MADEKRSKVPTSRLGRFSRMTRLAGGIAGGIAAEGIRQIGKGNRPKIQDLILTPNNAKRFADEMAKMRGAAMKLGQILSMDGGDILPRELADILSRLRSDAFTMPRKQLKEVLVENYGDDWKDQFGHFELNPIAAASIGQVHKVETHEGDVVALKIQYPGIKSSIDSDVDNLAGLLRVTGLLPKEFALDDLLTEVKLQLHDEADYRLEGEYLSAFNSTLADDKRFLIPSWNEEYSTETILAMDYIEAENIETIAKLPADERNAVVKSLFELMLRELFELQLMQTDPNFANYQYQSSTQRIVLLDFGACRRFDTSFSEGYRQLILAILSEDKTKILLAAENIGYKHSSNSAGYQAILVDIFMMIGEIFSSIEPYDFKDSDIVERMSEVNEAMTDHRNEWQTPPIDSLFFHRKLGGLFLLASRVDAKVAMRPLLDTYL